MAPHHAAMLLAASFGAVVLGCAVDGDGPVTESKDASPARPATTTCWHPDCSGVEPMLAEREKAAAASAAAALRSLPN